MSLLRMRRALTLVLGGAVFHVVSCRVIPRSVISGLKNGGSNRSKSGYFLYRRVGIFICVQSFTFPNFLPMDFRGLWIARTCMKTPPPPRKTKPTGQPPHLLQSPAEFPASNSCSFIFFRLLAQGHGPVASSRGAGSARGRASAPRMHL